MGLRVALVDRAYPQRKVADAVKVNGRTIHAAGEGPAVRCRLVPNAAGERAEDGRKIVEARPTVTLDMRDVDRDRYEPRKTDKLRIVSRELGQGTWEIDGKPEPIRKKRRVIGWTATVVRLEED